MINNQRSSSLLDNYLKTVPFPAGAVLFLAWFLWQARTVTGFQLEEWLIFYIIALLSWHPTAAWLGSGARWVPAGELFFLLHLPYYVAPFVRGSQDFAELETWVRIKIGLIIAVFLLVSRLCYGFHQGTPKRLASGVGFILDRTVTFEWRNQLAWSGLIAWCLFTISLQQGWLSDLGTYFNAIRSLIWSAGTIGMFILFKEMGDGRLTKSSKVVLMAVTVLTVLFQVLSGFLTGGVLQVSAVFLAMFLGTRRVPVTAVLSVVALFAFLHVGKADMRDEFWEAGKNYSTEWHNPVDILTFWTTASWKRLATESESDEEVRSLLDRGNLLGFLARVVADSPELIPFLGGTTYWQTVDIFIPRFISPDKPRSSTPNDTLAIQYGVLSINSADYTGVGLGRISEAWANFGWAGIIVIGAIMGLTLQIPTRLSGGYSPMHVRFLLAIPFVEFGMNLESCLGPTVHALFNGLLLSVVFLWVASLPTSAPVVDKTPLPEWLRDPR